jgi:UDP-N-acetylglucosamine acyltransferase
MNTYKLANVHPDAKIGEGVVIEPFATVMADVVIGDGTWVGPGAVIMDGARIGKHCQIHPGAVIANIPQDLKFSGEKTYVEIGDYTNIRECVTINRGTVQRNLTKVGSHTLIMAYSHLGHDTFVGNHCVIVNSCQIAGVVDIEDWAVIGGQSGVHQFSKVGAHSMTAGGTVIRKDIPPYVTAGREPISYFGVNSTGLKRRGFTNEKIQYIQDIYRIIFQQKRNYKSALEIVERDFEDSQEKTNIINFIRSSERGIIRGFHD